MSLDGNPPATLPSKADRRSAERPRTIPEQIADDIAASIIQGRYNSGERVLEQDVSESYGVSRGPVREAIRSLEKRGLLEFFPRRGAYVVGLSPDLFADLFNVRLALIGMAALQFTVCASEEARELLVSRLGAARQRVAGATAEEFVDLVSGITQAIYKNCGNIALGDVLADQSRSLWGMIWHAQPLDFHTRKRRQAVVLDWTAVLHAIQASNASQAEKLARAAMARFRDVALNAYAELRGQSVDPSKLWHDSPS